MNRAKVTKQTRNLEVKLTPEERAERQTTLLRLLDQADAEEQKKKESASEFSKKIQELNRLAVKARREIATGSTFRDVECECHVEGGSVIVMRLDTGEVIERRNAHVSESQIDAEEYLR